MNGVGFETSELHIRTKMTPWLPPSVQLTWAFKHKTLTEQVNPCVNYSQSFVYCRVFVLLIIDYSTKKGVLVYSRKMCE